jgi:hypothetical protein
MTATPDTARGQRIVRARYPVTRRAALITAATAVGALLMIPYLMAGGRVTPASLTIFGAGSLVVAALTGYIGLRLADRLDLPMPILRPWEHRTVPDGRSAGRALAVGAAAGVLLGGLAVLLHQAFPTHANPGTLLERLATTVWTTSVTGTVGHLFLLGIALRFIPNRWLAIVLNALVFTALFHLDRSLPLDGMLAGAGLSLLGMVAIGWILVRTGFEATLVTHAVLYATLVTLN